MPAEDRQAVSHDEDRVIVVISGPGGVGKGTIVDRLLERDPRLWLSRSWTTREPRPGEAPDAYHFTTPERFRRHIDEGGFLEWVEFLDYMLGTPLPDPPSGHDVIFEIDVRGAAEVKKRFRDALLVFVDAPSRSEQRQRLEGRGDPNETVLTRLAKAAEEVEQASRLGATTVVNDDLEEAVAGIAALIEDRRTGRAVSGPG